jgi:flavorubredoxin
VEHYLKYIVNSLKLLYCTAVAVEGLKNHYPSLEEAEFIIVKTGDALDLDGASLAFLEAPLLH